MSKGGVGGEEIRDERRKGWSRQKKSKVQESVTGSEVPREAECDGRVDCEMGD